MPAHPQSPHLPSRPAAPTQRGSLSPKSAARGDPVTAAAERAKAQFYRALDTAHDFSRALIELYRAVSIGVLWTVWLVSLPFRAMVVVLDIALGLVIMAPFALAIALWIGVISPATVFRTADGLLIRGTSLVIKEARVWAEHHPHNAVARAMAAGQSSAPGSTREPTQGQQAAPGSRDLAVQPSAPPDASLPGQRTAYPPYVSRKDTK